MEIDLMNVLYTTFMILLAFLSAIILTKGVSKYSKKFEDEDEEEDKKENQIK